MSAYLDVVLRRAWYPSATGRPPLSWPCVLMHPEARPVPPTVSKIEAAHFAREAARQRAEAFALLSVVWRIGQPPRWTGPRRVVICPDELPEAVA